MMRAADPQRMEDGFQLLHEHVAEHTDELCLQARDNRVAPEVCQSVSGRVRGSPKRVMTLVLKLVMAVMWSPAVVMTRRQ